MSDYDRLIVLMLFLIMAQLAFLNKSPLAGWAMFACAIGVFIDGLVA